MPYTIAPQHGSASRCAVFKIDLKGRLVYIDEQTEDLFGLSCEELFGKSIFDFISSSSRRTLDQIMFHHNRYESFFQAVQLSYNLRDGKLHQIDTVLTLNFIGGSPANYQLILLPTQSVHEIQTENIEKEFLKLLDQDIENIDLNKLARLLCMAGEYAEAEFYFPNRRKQLVTIASFPERETGINAPAYIELFATEPQDRYSFNSDDRSRHEGFGLNRTESLQFLNYRKTNDLILRLTGPAEHQPGLSAVKNLMRLVKLWNLRFQTPDDFNSKGQSFSLIGRICDKLNIELVITDNNYDIVYRNDSFGKWQAEILSTSNANNLKEILSSIDLYNIDDSRIEFSNTPFSQAVINNSCVSARIHLLERSPVLVISTPFKIGETNLYIHAVFSHLEMPSSDDEDFTLQSLAHDLRAPLISIDAFVRRLVEKSTYFEDERDIFTINCLRENVDIMHNMIGAIEEMPNHWNYREEYSIVSISRIIKGQIDRLKVAYADKEYKINIPDDIPECKAPKNQLNRLFGNLLENAFKYSAGAKKPRIKINYSLADNIHKFSITDNGIGIPQEYLSKVFEPFFRNPDNIDIPGTGIGLSIARRIVQSWEGKISIDPAVKRGTAVVFTLPNKKGGKYEDSDEDRVN
ncbi:MAG: ATP-binding protein [Candidatus Zixiibacteriota bacterium]